MNAKCLVLVLTVILQVISVKGVCDDYLSCLGSFFSDFFNTNVPPLNRVIVENSNSRNVNLDTEDIDQILHDASGFLKKELQMHPKDLKSKLYHQTHNQTAIFVKTFDVIQDNLEDSDVSEKKETYFSPDSRVSDKATNVNAVRNLNGSTFNTTIQEMSSVTPVTGLVKNETILSVLTTESLKQVTKDEHKNEINTKDESHLYYDNDEDNATDYPILDYIEYYKDTTNEYVNLEATVKPNINKNNMNNDTNSHLRNTSRKTRTKGYASNIEELSTVVFPWIAAIFVKDSTLNQFTYFCDGALLSPTVVVTAATNMYAGINMLLKPEDLVVLLGKTSLKDIKGNEKAARVKFIKVNENYKDKKPGSDLALLVLEEPVTYTNSIKPAVLATGDLKEEPMATTGWAATGELTAIALKTRNKTLCGEEASAEDTVCTEYGREVIVCPSYGGLYVTKQDTWYLRGIRAGDPEDQGLCINHDIAYTSLRSHWDWIKLHLE